MTVAAPRPTHTVDPVDLAWVAGLAEGEGCFTQVRKGEHPSASFTMNMTDEDVVRRAQACIGVGTITVLAKQRLSHHKTQWRWQVAAQAELAWLMDLLYPYLGERRRARIDELRATAMPAWATTEEAAA